MSRCRRQVARMRSEAKPLGGNRPHARSRCRQASALSEAEIVATVRSARTGLRGRVPCRRQAASGARRRCGDLCRQPQHQLHEHLHLRLQVLRLLQGPAQLRAARQALRPELRRDRAAHARGLGSAAPPRCACRAASVRATRAKPISSIVNAVKSAAPGHSRARLLAAGDLARRDDARAAAARLSGEAQGRPGWRACRAPPPKSSMTRCAPSCAPTRSPPRSGWR